MRGVLPSMTIVERGGAASCVTHLTAFACLLVLAAGWTFAGAPESAPAPGKPSSRHFDPRRSPERELLSRVREVWRAVDRLGAGERRCGEARLLWSAFCWLSRLIGALRMAREREKGFSNAVAMSACKVGWLSFTAHR